MRIKLRFIIIPVIFILVVGIYCYFAQTVQHRKREVIESQKPPAGEPQQIHTEELQEQVSDEPFKGILVTEDEVALQSSSESKEEDEAYDYFSPVPLGAIVEDTYFDDAVFIGDSRTEGFFLYVGPGDSRAFVHKGLTVDTVMTDPVINLNGDKCSVIQALQETGFCKVYIMLGINETGWVYSSVFIEKYAALIKEIRKINPDAIIYLQSILPVSENVSAQHSYITNEKISEYNVLIQQLAGEQQVYYLNVAEAVVSENGALPEEAAFDGIHLNREYCEKWLEYLNTHTVPCEETKVDEGQGAGFNAE